MKVELRQIVLDACPTLPTRKQLDDADVSDNTQSVTVITQDDEEEQLGAAEASEMATETEMETAVFVELLFLTEADCEKGVDAALEALEKKGFEAELFGASSCVFAMESD
jgi:hypothetical protein